MGYTGINVCEGGYSPIETNLKGLSQRVRNHSRSIHLQV